MKNLSKKQSNFIFILGQIQDDFWGGLDLIKLAYLTYSKKQSWASSVGQDQTLQNVASDKGLNCLLLIKQFHTHS